jgi:uncharacterized protein (DUF2336 family)
MPPDEATRVRRSADPHSEMDVLAELAHDASVTVRAALALNTSAPTEANDVLTHDQDERVRILLARKLAALIPELSSVDHVRLYSETWNTLQALAADEATRVRAIIADAVKELPDAPRDMILRLAWDMETSVCDPVIRLSPLLTTQDLVALVADAPSAGTVLAIARRADLDPAVSDAIAQSANSAAILALLANRSAQIREATLDALVAHSVDHPDWHAPLVRRPALPPRAARMLSEIVANSLLSELAARADLPLDLAQELRRRVAMRLTPAVKQDAAVREVTVDEAIAQARALAARGELTEQVLLAAAQRGEARVSAALLAVAAGTPVSVVDRAASLRSAKGLISLVWKAGFTMRVAVALQTLLARLAPDAVLMAGPGGGFPLAVEEMRWQLEFLARMGT